MPRRHVDSETRTPRVTASGHGHKPQPNPGHKDEAEGHEKKAEGTKGGHKQ